MIIIPENHYVALICEGKSEKTIMSMLLEENQLCFNTKQLLEDKIITDVRSAKSMADRYLGYQFDQPIHIIIIQDSKTILWMDKLTEPYKEKIRQIIYCVTSPEIEMLMVHSIECYDDYQKKKSQEKPSTFVKNKLNNKTIKTEAYIRQFFTTYDLVDAVRLYKSKAPRSNRIMTIADLLSEQF